MKSKIEHYQELVAIAASKGGKVISEEYERSTKKMEFEDKQGNRWWATSATIKRGHWSPFEAGLVRDPEYHLAELREIAAKRGGKVISEKYEGTKTKMEFEDSKGRRWWTTSSIVKRGSWSPFEDGTIKDPERRMVELREIAELHGGKVISEKYEGTKTKMEFEDDKGRRWWTMPAMIKRGHWSPFAILDRGDENARHLAELREIAESRGGKVISEEYESSTKKMEFEDREGRRWWATPASIKTGTWAPFAFENNYKPEYHMSELRRIAAERGGKVLSKKYVNKSTKLRFQDKQGRRWWATPASIKSGSWSPFEARERGVDSERHMSELREIAASKGGRVISEKYEGALKKMEFEDHKGNRWWVTPANIKSGHWSPFVHADQERHLAELQRIAASKGGKVISEKYEGAKTKMEFETASGVRFCVRPERVKSGWWPKRRQA